MSSSMISVAGITYRITRIRSGFYQAVRLIDDVVMGTFSIVPALQVQAACCDEPTLRQIAHVALREAKTSWVGTLDVSYSAE